MRIEVCDRCGTRVDADEFEEGFFRVGYDQWAFFCPECTFGDPYEESHRLDDPRHS